MFPYTSVFYKLSSEITAFHFLHDLLTDDEAATSLTDCQ